MWGYYREKLHVNHLCELKGKGHKNKGNDHHLKKPLIVKQFSLSAPQKMYREQYGEYVYWCWGVKGLMYFMQFSPYHIFVFSNKP